MQKDLREKTKKLSVAVDATPLTQPKAGIGTCVFYWLDELLKLKPEYRFFLYAPAIGGDLEYFARYPHVTIRTNAFLRQSHTIWGQTTLAYLLYRDRIDVFWATAQLSPLCKRKKMKVLLSLHDFVYLLYPETASWLKSVFQRLFSYSMFKRADYILPNSHGTSRRLKEYYGFDHHTVVEPPIKPYLKAIDPAQLQAWFSAKNLRYKEYLLAIGTMEPRKNFEKVLSVMEEILLKDETVFPLVIMGGEGWKNSCLKNQLRKLQNQYRQKIITTGYSSDEEQWKYLAGARYLLMLSKYEGYGMPIAEARVCGTQVICADTPEMREAAQPEGIFLSF